LLLQVRRQKELEKKKEQSLLGDFTLNTEDVDLEKGAKEFKDFQRAKQKLEMVHKKSREEKNLKEEKKLKKEKRERRLDRLRFEQERIE